MRRCRLSASHRRITDFLLPARVTHSQLSLTATSPLPLPHRRNGGEESRLRLASSPDARERDSVGEVPAGELGGGGFVVAVVQQAEPGGAEEIAGAEVVDDVDLYRPASRILDQGKIISRPVCPAARWLPAAPIRPAWNWDRTNDIY